MLVCAPSDECELVHMVHTVSKINDSPTALRYPRGNGYGKQELPKIAQYLEPGKGRIVREGVGGELAILSVGTRLQECLDAAVQLEQWGISITVADARWVKPLDTELVGKLATEHRALITIEENAIGGFAAQVHQTLLEGGHLDGVKHEPCAVRSMMFPDRYIDHHSDQRKQYDDAKLNADSIVEKAISLLSRIGIAVDVPTVDA